MLPNAMIESRLAALREYGAWFDVASSAGEG